MKAMYRLLTAITCSMLLFPNSSSAQTATAKITSLKNEDQVTTPTRLQGECNAIPAGTYLWVVVRPENTQNYHPQSDKPDHGPVSNGCNGSWKGIAYLGESADKNISERFELLIVGANQTGNAAMTSYLAKANKDHDWTGMSELPEDTTVYNTITVVRR